jgi:hypothetical protein
MVATLSPSMSPGFETLPVRSSTTWPQAQVMMVCVDRATDVLTLDV